MSLRLAVLSVAAVVACVCPAPAGDFEKYLPADTCGVVTVDVAQVVAAKPFDKHLRKPAEGLLGHDKVAPVLKLAGVDPLKDVTRVTVAFAASLDGNRDQPSSGAGLFAVVNGKFDAKKIHETVEKLAADGVGIEGHKVGDRLVYEFPTPLPGERDRLFAAVVDAGTVVVTSHRATAEEVLKVAAKKDAAVPKDVESLVGSLDVKQTAAWAFDSRMMSSKSVSSTQAGNQPPVVKVTIRTFGDDGVESASGGVTVGDKIAFTTRIAFQKPEALTAFVKSAEQTREMGVKMLGQLAASEKGLVPAVEAIKGVKLTPKEKTLTVTGEVDSEVIGVVLKFLGAG